MSFLRASFDPRSYYPPVWFAEADETGALDLLHKGGGPIAIIPWWVMPYYREEIEEEPEDLPVDRAAMLATMFPGKKQRKRAAKAVSRAAGERKASDGTSAPTEEQLVAKAHAAALAAADQAIEEIKRSVQAMEDEAAAMQRQLLAAMLMFEMM